MRTFLRRGKTVAIRTMINYFAKLLRAPDDNPAADPSGPSPDPLPDPQKGLADPLPPSPVAAPPVVAKTALEGTVTEREAALAKRLKAVETEAAALKDENDRLKTPPPKPPPAAVKKSWLSGGTFFED